MHTQQYFWLFASYVSCFYAYISMYGVYICAWVFTCVYITGTLTCVCCSFWFYLICSDLIPEHKHIAGSKSRGHQTLCAGHWFCEVWDSIFIDCVRCVGNLGIFFIKLGVLIDVCVLRIITILLVKQRWYSPSFDLRTGFVSYLLLHTHTYKLYNSRVHVLSQR